jgi:hypothetical protein
VDELEDELTAFVCYSKVTEWSIQWSDENNWFLKEIGLPSSAPTMINFEDEVDLSVTDHYVEIGSNNYGDRIVVMRLSGEVCMVNHDCKDRLEYINRDVVSLFKSICAFQKSGGSPLYFKSAVQEFDPKAIEGNGWWARELRAFNSN